MKCTNIMYKRSLTQSVYILYDSIYIKFQNMQNYSVMLDIMIVVVYWKMVGGGSGEAYGIYCLYLGPG